MVKHNEDYIIATLNQALEDLIYGNIPDKALSLLTRYSVMLEEQYGKRPIIASKKLKIEVVA